jgi:hypothetical protein
VETMVFCVPKLPPIPVKLQPERPERRPRQRPSGFHQMGWAKSVVIRRHAISQTR